MTFEYKVVPAPTRGQKGKGIKGPEARFANALELNLNALAAEGWEFLRAETLPNDERSGLTGTTTTFRTVLVYRRPTPVPTQDRLQTIPTPPAEQIDMSEDQPPSEASPDPADDVEISPREQDEVVQVGVQSLKQD
jgi:hypothetical protein